MRSWYFTHPALTLGLSLLGMNAAFALDCSTMVNQSNYFSVPGGASNYLTQLLIM